MLSFDNEVEVTVRSGKTGEVAYRYEGCNSISDDILGPYGRIYFTPMLATTAAPYCFILPDGSQWTSFTFDRQNPWAPYCATANNSVDPDSEPQWAQRQSVGGYTAPTNTVTGKHKLFFEWGIAGGLPFDFQLRAIGLTGWQNSGYTGGDITAYNFGVSVADQPSVIVPQTLLILPSAVTVHGRNGGSGTPDILQISYFLSVVGTS